MEFTKTYSDACVTYYENDNYKIIVRKSGCTIKSKGNLFNILGDEVATTKTLDEALKLFA